MNVITIAGNLGHGAELKTLPSGEYVANFSVADAQGKDAAGVQKPPIWWRCQLFGRRAETLAQYLTRGAKVTVTGRASQRSYTGQDGTPKTVMEIRVADIALQDRRDENTAPQYAATPAPQSAPQPTPAQQAYAQTAAIWGQPKPLTYAAVKNGTPYVPPPAQPAPQAAPAQTTPAGVFVPQAAPAPAPQTEAPAPAGFDNFADDDIQF